jgi:hypothetical protein
VNNYARALREIQRLRAALAEIAEGRGRFSLDQHEFACNAIEDMKQLAVEALKGAP